MDDQALGFFASLLGVFIFFMAIVYHFVIGEPKYASN